MVSSEDFRLIGARKLLLEAAGLKVNERLLILSHESRMSFTQYLLKAAKLIGAENTTLMMIPTVLRPVTRISEMWVAAISKANVLIYVIDRMPEETSVEWGPLMKLCREHRCRYITMHDPKPWYLEKGGILGDYRAVDEKSKKVAAILEESEKVEITSEAGTNFAFRFDPGDGITYRSPSILSPEMSARGHVQAPEGEVAGRPIQDTVNGRLVADGDGAITCLGRPSVPVAYIYKDGKLIGVEGDKTSLAELCKYVGRLGGKPVLDSLDTLEEIAIGTNDWAVLDDNISNCEKVTGTLHFGIGHLNEWSHIDHIMTTATVMVIDKKGKKTRLIEKGRLIV